ncbi:DinB family protein [Mucilaginibacter sp. X4EP1]|uniref:DinB family protein n=1 Tax=Mucilaginibacter sp. X4EP1 TaxID=2723092 RepID=UPI00216A1E47|nr:DinB family protein [Mucilaginibacter sp. X4EP1]MCS3816460.1 putative damage-inducible protein DinB [Mucilaginibacter sp. X4EP1]
MENLTEQSAGIISSAALLEHWQGHRRVTRKVIESFPEEQLFNYSLGRMRPFVAMALEVMSMSAKGVNGILTNKWLFTEELEPLFAESAIKTKADILWAWDVITVEINRLFVQIEDERFTEQVKAFGKWEGTATDILLYIIDNEIHHRGQGMVYLRSLDIEPPAFWNRN